MTQLAIKLTDELTDFVQASVQSGAFHSASEMVANALHALKSQDDAKLAALRSEIALGAEQALRGEFVEFDAESIIVERRKKLSSKAS